MHAAEHMLLNAERLAQAIARLVEAPLRVERAASTTGALAKVVGRPLALDFRCFKGA
jgi:hypothetical protein